MVANRDQPMGDGFTLKENVMATQGNGDNGLKVRMDEFVTALADLKHHVETVEAEVEALKSKSRGGPKSEKAMADVDAFRCKYGDLKAASHKEAAAALGLSYGQVFSCRGSYTFKHVRADWTPTVLDKVVDHAPQDTPSVEIGVPAA